MSQMAEGIFKRWIQNLKTQRSGEMLVKCISIIGTYLKINTYHSCLFMNF